ncbi:MAG: PilT/PilU family type 4a pilus ATPase [Acidobacteriota bacterium]
MPETAETQLTLDNLLRGMAELKASDIHLKVTRPPLVRLRGELVPMPGMEGRRFAENEIRGMLEAIMNPRQRECLQENMSVDLAVSIKGVSRFRINAFHQRGSLEAVFRYIPHQIGGLEDWELPDVLLDLARKNQGLVLVTGPAGTGKSTTLAALLKEVNDTRNMHIVTIEDPIEFLFRDVKSSVSQREIGTDTPSFARALRDVLRQDPDLIMVGEMRDLETMETVLTAAETGHLVYSTLHTNSAAQTLDRILDMFPQDKHKQVQTQLAEVLVAIVSLQLVKSRSRFGRSAAVEIMFNSPKIQRMIREGELKELKEEIENSVSYYKMQSMNQSLIALLVNGLISKEEAIACSPSPDEFELLVQKLVGELLGAGKTSWGGEEVKESPADYSKIEELKELKKMYSESTATHQDRLEEKDQQLRSIELRLRQTEEEMRKRTEGFAAASKKLEVLEREVAFKNQEKQRLVDMLQQKDKRIQELSTELEEARKSGFGKLFGKKP